MVNIVVIGSINMDLVMKVFRLPQKGETLTADSFMTIPGGKGANQAVAVSRLGGKVSMIGAVGSDSYGDALMKNLQENHIHTSGVKRDGPVSGNAMITVDQQGDNTILVFPGANKQVTPQWIESQKCLIQKCDWVMLQLEIPMESVSCAIKLAKSMNKKVLLNPAPAVEIPQELYPLIDVLTPNETELALLSDMESLDLGAKELLKKGSKMVVATLGSEGSMAVTDEMQLHSPAFSIKAVDATAAGDAFNGALIVAIEEGKHISEALAFANGAGAMAATVMGAQKSLPTRESLDKFIEKQKMSAK